MMRLVVLHPRCSPRASRGQAKERSRRVTEKERSRVVRRVS